MSNLTQVNMFNGGDPAAMMEPTRVVDLARVVGPASRMDVIDGEMVDRTQARETATVAEVNPHHGTESALATARHPRGLPVYAIEADTLVTINGVEATVAFWCKEGHLQKTATGYTDATPQAAQEAPQVSEGLDDHAMAAVAQSLQGIEPSNVDGLIATGIGAAIGKVDTQTLVAKFSQLSGADHETSAARLSVAADAFQKQADGVAAGEGIAAADLDAFYAHCRRSPAALQDALSRQIHGKDMSGFRKLAQQWISSTPPSMAAVQAAGLPTRSLAGKQEVFVRGTWMSLGAAGRAGLL